MSVGALHYEIRELPPNILYVCAEMRGRGLDRLVLCCTDVEDDVHSQSFNAACRHSPNVLPTRTRAGASLTAHCMLAIHECIPNVLHQCLTKRACRSSRSFVHFRTRLPCVTTWLTGSPVRGKRSYFLASLSTFLNLGDDMHP